MAIIGTIRKNSWLLIILLGLALAAFVVMDLFSGNSRLGVQELTLGEVNGKKIDYKEFNDMDEALYSGSNADIFARRNYLWSFFTNKAVIEDEAKVNGFGIGKEELDDIQFGTNISPVIRQRFVNPQTGQVDMSQLQNMKQQIQSGSLTDPDARRYWHYQEKEVIADRMEQKISGLLGKSFYTPNWMAQELNVEQNQRATFEYLKWAYDTLPVPENKLQVTDTDIKNYIQENKSDLIRLEEERAPQFVMVRVTPTKADTAEIRSQIEGVVAEFREAENDTTFILNKDGELWTEYRLKDNVDPAYADAVFSEPVGTVLGPIESNGSIAAIKIMDRKQVADSVKSRHILRSARTQEEYINGYNFLDSLKTEIEEGRANFDQLARTQSQGPSGPQGGDLGYATMGRMVKPFNDLIFYQAVPGELNIVATEFGVHLVEVTGRKFVNNNQGVSLAIVSEAIVPSDATQDSVYQIAERMVSTCRNLDELRDYSREHGLRLRNGNPVKENDFSFGVLGSGSEPREMVKWLYDANTSVGSVSPVVYSFQNPTLYYTENVVVLGLKEILEEGLPTVEELRAQVEPALRNKKKGDIYIAETIGGSIDIDALSNKFNMPKLQGNGVSFATDIINGVGDEPEVVAAVAQLGVGEVSKPIKGQSGIFIVKVIDKPAPPQTPTLAPIKQNNDRGMIQQARAAMMKSLKDAANITDDRSNFY